jgi:hypothetical protein
LQTAVLFLVVLCEGAHLVTVGTERTTVASASANSSTTWQRIVAICLAAMIHVPLGLAQSDKVEVLKPHNHWSISLNISIARRPYASPNLPEWQVC